MTEQPRQLGASMDDLLRLIGQLTVENQLLRAEITRLTAETRPAPQELHVDRDALKRALESSNA